MSVSLGVYFPFSQHADVGMLSRLVSGQVIMDVKVVLEAPTRLLLTTAPESFGLKSVKF